MLLPILSFYPALAWLLFSCVVPLSYLKYVSPTGIIPAWIPVLEYGLLFTLLAGGSIIGWLTKNKSGGAFAPARNDSYLLTRL